MLLINNIVDTKFRDIFLKNYPFHAVFRHQGDLWRCVDEAECTFNDQRLQLAVMRDPRAVAVSAYFHALRVYPERYPALAKSLGSVDSYFQQMLKPICMWTTIRHLIFSNLLSGQSEVFWFEDMLADSVDWYGRLFSFIGVTLPYNVISGMAHMAERGDPMFGFFAKGVDEHPGGVKPGGDRTFRSELGPESLAMMDDVLRAWLPPVLLKRLGVSP